MRVFEPMNMRRLAAAAAALAVLVSLEKGALAGPNDSSDERRMQATTLLDEGKKLAASDPKGALAAFRLSYEIRPDFRVQYNIARVCLRLADKDCARDAFEQYLKGGGNEIPTKRRKEVEAELKALGGSTAKGGGSLTIKSSVSGAYVKVDGVVVGRTPLEKPVPVSAGSHKVVLVVDGNVVEKSVSVASGATESVELEPKTEEAASPPEPEKEKEPEPEPARTTATTKRRGVPVLPWVVTGALAAGTVVTGYLTLQAQSDYDAKRGDFPITRDELDAAHAKGKNLLLVTGILGASTLIAGGLAGYFTLSRGSASAADKTVGVAVGPGGIAIAGRLP